MSQPGGLARATAILRSPPPKIFLPAAPWDIASLQGSLTSAMCDFMQALIPPVPGSIPAHSFAMSALHTFPVTAIVSTRSWQLGDRSVKCHFYVSFDPAFAGLEVGAKRLDIAGAWLACLLCHCDRT